MNRIIQVKVFNGLLDNFFDFLETISIDVQSDIILTRSTINFIRKSNPRLVVEQYIEYTLPFRKEIKSCNEKFFLNHSDINSQNNHNNLILKLKHIWKSLDKKQKATIFYYLNKLINSSEKCI
jgi:hypothetical protein